MNLLVVFEVLCVVYVSVAIKNREKRLVLHSDTDIATEVLKLGAEIAELKAENTNLNATLRTEIAQLTLANTKLSKSLADVQISLNNVYSQGR